METQRAFVQRDPSYWGVTELLREDMAQGAGRKQRTGSTAGDLHMVAA